MQRLRCNDDLLTCETWHVLLQSVAYKWGTAHAPAQHRVSITSQTRRRLCTASSPCTAVWTSCTNTCSLDSWKERRLILRAEHLRSMYKRSGSTHVPHDRALWKTVWISATMCHTDAAFSFPAQYRVVIKFQAYIWVVLGQWLPRSVVNISFSQPPERYIKNP
jgi:hypothetical protein